MRTSPWRHGLVAVAATALLVGGVPAVSGTDSVRSAAGTAVGSGTGAVAGSSDVTAQRARRCSRGLVALTFDDGPRAGTTRQVMRILLRKRAPGTFFAVGERVRGHRKLVRTLRSRGFRVANHTYGHENLTGLSNARIRSTLRRTNRALRDVGVPKSGLMRPPYGAINDRVRRVVRGLGMRPVLWDVDSRDWDGRSADKIIRKVMSQLDPGRNIVLLHDGVANSNQTVAALPRLIRKIRRHGYCLAALNRRGGVKTPVPRARVRGAAVRERNPGQPAYLRFAVRLNKPTSRPVSVRVRTRQGTALAGRDFQARRFRLRFPVGTTHRAVRVKVFGDAKAEPNERLRLRLSHPRRLRIADGVAPGTIRDND